MDEKIAIGVDLGGTRIKAVAITLEGKILYHRYTPTPNGSPGSWKKAVAAIIESIRQETATRQILIGISAPGLPNKDNSCIEHMPGRLNGLENFVWQSYLHATCYVLNDGVAAMAAEAKLGAAKHSTNAILVTLGTGVGGGLLIDGKIFQGSHLKAGHIGHMVVDCNEEADITGMPGSLEYCIGNYSVEKRSQGQFKNTHDLLLAHKAGNKFASGIWEKSVQQLAMALASASNLLSPDTIIIGGGIAEANDDLFFPLQKWFQLYEWQPGSKQPVIVKAVYGDLAGAIGAGCFALQMSQNF